ncbi:BTB/POZ protein [Rhizophagus irregularis DAOM 181602=DAOM 197198]|nr:BTB/POZ protein [Rhizophagus irregularis DAOM 181602=DAOM 197198]
MSDNKFLPKLSQNLLEILGDEEFYDVTIEKNDGTIGTLTHIKLSNISPEIFQIILKYIYGGKLSLEEFDASYIVKILVAASELSLQELIPHTQSFLINNQADWIEQNFIQIYQTSFESDSFLELQKPVELKPIKTISSESVNSIVNSNKQAEFTPKVGSISIDSIIIKIQHAELISKWIDRLEITDKAENLYEFKLIYRGSRDGFNAYRFHDYCDNKSHTIAILKVKDRDEILGGYNPIEWKSEGFGVTNDSFIFSFKNNENIEDYLLSRVKDKEHAINYSGLFGPSFGESDLTLLGVTCYIFDGKTFNKCYCKKSSYERFIRNSEDEFLIEEYEIFQINI